MRKNRTRTVAWTVFIIEIYIVYSCLSCGTVVCFGLSVSFLNSKYGECLALGGHFNCHLCWNCFADVVDQVKDYVLLDIKKMLWGTFLVR